MNQFTNPPNHRTDYYLTGKYSLKFKNVLLILPFGIRICLDFRVSPPTGRAGMFGFFVQEYKK